MKKLLQIDGLLKFSKVITLVALIISLISVVSSLFYGVYVNENNQKERVYILDRNGDAFTSKIIKDELMYREPEIRNHLRKFHKYFFNIDQYNYVNNVEKSLALIDESGKNYYLTLLNDGWYNSLKMNNLVQNITIDSINVNADTYPYLGFVYGKTSVYRYGNRKKKKEKIINIQCKLYDVGRTTANPHGLLISNYDILYHGKK